MKKILTLLACTISGLAAHAQWMPDGSTMNNNIIFNDINGTTHNFYNYAASGKHIFLDLFKMNCGICEGFHTGKAFENYYNAYAKPGTIQDAVVIQYQVTSNLSLNDLKGLNPSTTGQGSTFDWITGTSYPTANVANTTWSFYQTFLPTGTTSLSYGTPTLFLICADKKFYEFSSSFTAAQMRTLAQTKCGLAALGTNEIHTTSFSYNISPNPANNILNVDVRNMNRSNVNITITNALGQVVYTEVTNNSNVDHFSTINTSAWNAGLYFINLQDGKDKITSRVMISH